MRLRAHAKINFSLRVFEKRLDGFHNLESIMQSVSLCDYITLTPISSGIEVVCSDPKVPQGKENIAYRAAELLGGKVKIHIEKNIPMAAGLAGGSADAAAVIYGMNQMSKVQSPPPEADKVELLELAAQIGSDVPFCLIGGTCLVKGRGEIVEKQMPWPKTYFVLVCPRLEVSAKWAYEEFDRMHLEVSSEIKNDLEPAVVSQHEVIIDLKEKLIKLGCSESQMSGSGPSVFGVVKQKSEAEKILVEIKSEFPRSFLVETVDRGVEVV